MRNMNKNFYILNVKFNLLLLLLKFCIKYAYYINSINIT